LSPPQTMRHQKSCEAFLSRCNLVGLAAVDTVRRKPPVAGNPPYTPDRPREERARILWVWFGVTMLLEKVTGMSPGQFFVFLQLLVTTFLVVLLWCLYSRLRKQELFRWWAWAWTASAAYLALGVLIFQLGPAWTPIKGATVLLAMLAGFLQVALLMFGAWSLRRRGMASRRSLRLGTAAALAAGGLSFMLALLWHRRPDVSFVLRSAPRMFALAVALLACAGFFFAQWRKSRTSAAAISGGFCLLYGINQGVYGVALVHRLIVGQRASLHPIFDLPIRAASIFSALDVAYVCGICLGLVLLLVEEHGRAERALLESANSSREIAENNAALQAEIRDREQMQQTLEESEAKFRLMAETVACGIWIHQDGRFRYFNPQVEAITGYSQQELAAADIWQLVHPDFREALRERSNARLRGEKVPSRYQYKILTRGGKERWIDFSAATIQYAGRPAVLASAFDITEAKLIEHQIRERTAYLQSLISNNPLAIAVMDAGHRLQLCNRAFEEMFLYSQNELEGANLDYFIAPESEEAAEFTRRIQGGLSVHATTRRYRKGGSPVDVELHGVPMSLDGRLVGCYGIYQDITERKKAEEGLRNLTFRVMQIQEEERARIARELHDDVSQRLGVLTFQLDQVLEDSLQAESPSSRQLISLSKIAHQLCGDIQHLTRHLHPSHVEIAGLVSAVSGFCGEYARQNGFEVEFTHSRVPDVLPQEVKLCLYRVAQEAIRNSQRHSGCRRVRVELIGSPEAIRLRVSDAGRGFEPNSARSFDGLGLVSMTERVKSLGGQFRVQSKPGTGTSVEASVPLAQKALGSVTAR
jgi:two-component system NarL family sensor kinase